MPARYQGRSSANVLQRDHRAPEVEPRRSGTAAPRDATPWSRRVLRLALLTVALLAGLGASLGACNQVTSNFEQADGKTAPPMESLKASPELAANGPITDLNDLQLKLLKHTLALVKTNYYDPSRVDWRKMMTHAFDALQSNLVEVVADFDTPLENTPGSVNLRVNTKNRQYDLTTVKDLSDVHEMSVDVARFVLGAVREETKAADLEYMLINGMLDTLDPHSVLLTPEVYKDMQTTHGGFGGLGIVIGIRDDDLTVISPIEGTPASRAGLKAGDKIMRIGQESTINMPLHEAVDRLRGDVGTAVEIEVLRKNWTEARTFTIVRDHIKIRSLITHALPKEKIAYVKVKAFEKNTAADIKERLKAMRQEMGQIDGLILDLRFNAGGLLNQAIAVADIFLPAGKTIVISEGIGGSQREEEQATADKEPDYPVVVITNAGSASASEIVAGALKNHDRAVILGDRTFGKGSVQILRDNDDGSAIKLTIAQYLTPGDISIQGVGITPDLHVVPVLVSKEDGVDLFMSEHIRREDGYETALTSDKVKTQEDSRYQLKYLYKDDEEAAAAAEEEYREDFEITLAKRLITSGSAADRLEALASASGLLQKVADEENVKIALALTGFNVVWDKPIKPQPQPFAVQVAIPDSAAEPPFELQAGTTVTLRATVTNHGDAPIQQLWAVTRSNNPVFDDRELLFGKILPGKSQSWDVELKIPRGGETRQDPVSLDFSDATGALGTRTTFELATRTLPGPRFAYDYQVDDSETGNGDGLLQAGESVKLLVHIANVGAGPSSETMASIRSESGAAMYLGKGRDTVGSIEPGAMKTAVMEFDVKGPKENTDFLEFALSIHDKDFTERVAETVRLEVREATTSVSKTSGFARFTADSPVWAGASEKSLTIADAKAGQVVRRVARTADGGLVRVSWSHGESSPSGWVRGALLEDASADKADEVALVAARTAPRVEFDPQPLVVDADHVELSGSIEDDESIADYRVYLWHRDGPITHAQKLDYGVAGRADKRFAVEVPLRSGVNRVTLVARDNQKLEGSQTIYIARP